MKSKQRKRNGFTLLEMLVVMLIIAIILLLTLPNLQQKEKIIRTKGCGALVEVVNSAILLYEIDQEHTPTSIDQLIAEGYLKEGQNACPNGSTISIINGEAFAN
ncbi:prepilin-type N-terminal cleavage/methylation domain-containing protein [Firmicutes bacterium M10-2]|nr:prepilin-type N-terminal cleavage/methylation domain-containing protein [Firmicutes bacterium M10-2]